MSPLRASVPLWWKRHLAKNELSPRSEKPASYVQTPS
jgi:hypothetical protein